MKKADGQVSLFASSEAKKIKNEKRQWSRPLSPERVKESARMAVVLGGGDPENEWHVLGQHQIQFGMYRGQAFLWLAENALEYAAYIVASMSPESEKTDSVNHLANKQALRRYISHFPEGRYAIGKKKQHLLTCATPATTPGPSCTTTAASSSNTASTAAPSTTAHPPSSQRNLTVSASLRSLLVGRAKSQQSLHKSVQKLCSPQKYHPCKYDCNMDVV